jgi:exosortase B
MSWVDRWWPDRVDPLTTAAIAFGLALLYVPIFWSWSHGVWAAETQGHELVIVSASGWLLFRQRFSLASLPAAASERPGNALFALGLLIYLGGRSLESVRLELVSLIVVLAALLLRHKGNAGLRVVWFPLFFLLFAIPLPFELVLTLTAPLKTGASAAATALLSTFGYPVGRSGVVLTIGQYQLLVNEACAGLQTMFTLEAMGLLYANLMHHASTLRNVLLAILVVPISFLANVVRVMAIALVTYYHGDGAGQGFLHGFSGTLLFVTALLLIASVDRLLGLWLPAQHRS